MTKKRARELARRARKYGHHRVGSQVWVFCPLCRGKVQTEKSFRETVVQALDREMLDHLSDEHGDE